MVKPSGLTLRIKAASARRKGDIMRIFLELAAVAAIVTGYWHEEKIIALENKIGRKIKQLLEVKK